VLWVLSVVLPSQTHRFPAEDLETARDIIDRAAALVDSRASFIESEGVDPAFAYPDANWAYSAPNAFVRLFKRVSRCDPEAIGQLRAFTQVFTGFNLYEMTNGPSRVPEHLDDYTDDVIAAALDRNPDYISRWERLVEDLPYRCIVAPPRRFGEIGHDVRGVIVNHDTVVYQERVKLLLESGAIAWLDQRATERREIRILEIGGGYGALASWFRSAFPSCSYTILDLPECLLFSGLYLSLSRPDVCTGWGVERVPFGLRFVPNYQADFLCESFDLVINTLSMSEMSTFQVRHYVSLMKSNWLQGNGLFFEQNQDNRHEGMLCAQDILSDEFAHRTMLGLTREHLTQGPANIWSLNPVELHSHREAGQTHASTVEMGISE
jgi:hypothetical protein